MPNTPNVEFNFKNNNVQTTTPQIGVSHVVARTTKGPFNKPDTVFSTFSAFQKVYGEEIVPDGTISNIKKAFENGSKLRVSRVEGANGLTYGVANTIPKEDTTSPEKGIFSIILAEPASGESQYQLDFSIKTREAGSPVLDDAGYNLDRTFYLTLSRDASGPSWKFFLTQNKLQNTIDSDSLLAKNLIITMAPYTAASGSQTDGVPAFIDAQAFVDFCNNTPNVEVVFEGISPVGGNSSDPSMDRVKTLSDAQAFLISHNDWYGIFQVDGTTLTSTSTVWGIKEGNNGGDSSADTWKKAYEATKDYSDGYQLILSHIHQHLPLNYLEATADVAKDVVNKFETVLYVEVPKENADGTPMNAAETLSKLKSMVPTIGYAKNIAFFGGGLQYYDNMGALQKCDVLGTVLGLGDTAASLYGPWYSFSGMNRGQVADAVGPVMENVGSPANYDKLQSLADWYMNVFVVKDTPNTGKRTMLWNGFTTNPKNDSFKFLSIVRLNLYLKKALSKIGRSVFLRYRLSLTILRNPKNDSFKFLSIVRLNLYLKKTLRPILESALEEPNIWTTWKNIYYQAARILNNLVDRQAISEYQWLGDQDVTSYDDLQVNNEADVRSGKYHVILKYKDIVPLQEVVMDITIDAANQSISVE